MKTKILSVLIILLLVCSITIPCVYAASPTDIDCKYFPFDYVPLPEDFRFEYAKFTNLSLFYYDYNTGRYYAIFTEPGIDLTYSVRLQYDSDLGGYKSGNIYQSDENGKPYEQVTLMYSNDVYEWSVLSSGQQYAKIYCVTEEIDVLYYGGSVEFIRDHVGGGSSMDEDTTKKWYDYIIDGIKGIFDPLYNILEFSSKTSEKFMELFNLFTDITTTIAEKTGENSLFKPIIDFLSGISQTAVDLLLPFMDFPGMREFLMVAVIVLLFGGIFKFAFSG